MNAVQPEKTPIVSRAAVPCTCGELFQGTLNGEACLVSCPIDIYSRATILDGADRPEKLGRKVKQALALLSAGNEADFSISIENPLPVGRGYGTSTADIGAALYAVGAKTNAALDPQQASRYAVNVEPTDSTIFPGLTLFAHRSGAFQRYLGHAPAAKILVIDPGGRIDSEEFNARDWKAQLKKLAAGHEKVFNLLCEGIVTNDLETLGEACTLSARLHQNILHNALLEEVLLLSRQVASAGVCRAHSGTIMGMLLAAERNDEAEIIEYCKKHLPPGVRYRFTRLVDGGVRMFASF